MDRNRGWEGDSVLLQKVRLVRACGSKLNITMHKSAGLLVRLVRACGSKHPDDCCAGIIMFGQARKSLWIEVLLAQRDVDSGDKRSADEICQQELKNAVCITLKEKGAQEKGSLMKNVIRTMGYARSSTSLVEAAEKGMKYGRKTGEIVQDEEKRFRLGN